MFPRATTVSGVSTIFLTILTISSSVTFSKKTNEINVKIMLELLYKIVWVLHYFYFAYILVKKNCSHKKQICLI